MTQVKLKEKIVDQSGSQTYKTSDFADDLDNNFNELYDYAEQYQDSLNSRKDTIQYDDATFTFSVTDNYFTADILDQIRVGVFDQNNGLLYYLDNQDIRFKENGEPANLYGFKSDTSKDIDGTTYTIKGADFGTVRVIFDKFYWKHKKVVDTHTWTVSKYFFLGSEVFPAFKAFNPTSGEVEEKETAAVDRYEGVLFDSDKNRPVNGVYIDVTISASSSSNTITFETSVQYLAEGDVLKDTSGVLGAADAVYTVSSVTLNANKETTSIVVNESINDVSSGTSISLRNDIDTVNDYVASFSGYKPVSDVSQEDFETLYGNWSGDVSTNLESFWTWQMRLIFTAIQYSTLNIQSALGAGKTGNSADYKYMSVTGLFDSNGITNAVDNTNDDQFAGGALTWAMENTYGNLQEWMTGLFVDDHIIKITDNNNVFGSISDYINTGHELPQSNGYWGELLNYKAILPASVDGGSSDEVGDYFYQNSGTNVGLSGGHLNIGAEAGVAFCSVGVSASYDYWSIGARGGSY